MTETPQPTSGSLEARIIRKCQVHLNTCPLTCAERRVEELGEVASFDHQAAVPPSIAQRLKEGLSSWLR